MIIENFSMVIFLNFKTFMYTIFCIYLIVSVFIITGCNKVEISESEYTSDSLKADILKIQKLKIYFGHRSVGNNIIQGLNNILDNYEGIELNIVDLDSVDELPENFFAHNRIGENGEPDTKCDGFVEQLNHRMGSEVDIAFFKYCFADIKESIDIKEAFIYYQQTYNRLKKQYPDIIFVHVTVPLSSGTRGWKRNVKKLLKMDDWSYPSNIKRNDFNSLILETFKGDPIFDLAKFESTYPDGKIESFSKDNKTYFSLIPVYTNDGGHLNEMGRKVVARELIRFLALLSK